MYQIIIIKGPETNKQVESCFLNHNSSIHFCCTDSLLMTHRCGFSLSIIIWRIGGGGLRFLCSGTQKFSWRPCLLPQMLWVRMSPRARCTILCDKVCQWLATGRWFSPGPLVSFTYKNDRHARYNWNIVESGVKHHQTNKQIVDDHWPQYF
jgi:hypothetical protein